MVRTTAIAVTRMLRLMFLAPLQIGSHVPAFAAPYQPSLEPAPDQWGWCGWLGPSPSQPHHEFPRGPSWPPFPSRSAWSWRRYLRVQVPFMFISV